MKNKALKLFKVKTKLYTLIMLLLTVWMMLTKEYVNTY